MGVGSQTVHFILIEEGGVPEYKSLPIHTGSTHVNARGLTSNVERKPAITCFLLYLHFPKMTTETTNSNDLKKKIK